MVVAVVVCGDRYCGGVGACTILTTFLAASIAGEASRRAASHGSCREPPCHAPRASTLAPRGVRAHGVRVAEISIVTASQLVEPTRRGAI